MELSLRASLEATVDGEGTVVVPGRLLLDIARSLPDSDVTIEHRPEEAVRDRHLRRGGATACTPTRPRTSRGCPRSTRRRCTRSTATCSWTTIARVGRSASRDESRPVLTGILVRFEPGKVVMAATDSYRLAVKETPRRGDAARPRGDHPGARAAGALAASPAGADEVQLGMQENHVVFVADNVWLTTRRIDGQFPNYRQLLPEQFEHELTLPRDEVLEVVRRVSLMAQRNSPLRLRFAEGELTVSAITQDVGEARESLPAPYVGDAMEIGFNAEFLRDGLDSVDSDSIKFKLISPLRPAVFEGDSGRLRLPDHADPPRRLARSFADRRPRHASPLPLVRSHSSSGSTPASCSSSAVTVPARRTCSSRCTSRRRASRRARDTMRS